MDFYEIPFPERRNNPASHAFGLKRELDPVIQVAMPTHDLLFRPVGVNDRLITNSVLADLIFGGFLHGLLLTSMQRTAVGIKIASNNAEVS